MGDPAKEREGSIHREAGVMCVSCHGGDPDRPDERSMDPARGFRKAPRGREIPSFCASCHSDPKKMRQYHLRTDPFAEYNYDFARHGKGIHNADYAVDVLDEAKSDAEAAAAAGRR